MVGKEAVSAYFQNLQDQITSALEKEDGKARFKEDKWERPGGGGGRTRVLELGNVIEKGGVNFSAVHGSLPPKIAQALKVDSGDFFATGVSIVMHPRNPMVPIIHMNVRYFELDNGMAWFGGGIDLTPIYIVDEDARFFHQKLKTVCDAHDESYYPKFKQWADDYFYIPHRKETRGVGGIFFDRLAANDTHSLEDRFAFVQAVGETFAPAYVQLIQNNREKPWSENEENWQMLRRGRYVEFNLVYDKGTKFGLDTDGRIESILMSLPLRAGWPYQFNPEPDSEEERTLQKLIKGKDWIN